MCTYAEGTTWGHFDIWNVSKDICYQNPTMHSEITPQAARRVNKSQCGHINPLRRIP